MFKNIVIPIDLSDRQSTKVIFPPAIKFAHNFDAILHLVYIMPDFGMKMMEDYLPRHWMKDQKVKYREVFEGLVSKHIPKDVESTCYIGRGAIYDEVISYSEKVSADIIMLSAVRPQLKGYMLGPNASKIVRHSAISVMVIRN